MKKEILKQLVDQPAHFAWAFAAVYIGLGAAPFGYAFAVAHITAIIYREYKQWPSSRWYDPYLDWAFFAGGALYGVYAHA